ncbi:MAG: pilus assembly protein PilM [Victivallales bacterium]|nr:pilus assembly protein PilM [Victivallales bacterium]
MRYRPAKHAYGIDLGQTSVKAIGIARSGGGVKILRHARLDIAAEGILDESELYGSDGLPKWLGENRLTTQRAVLGVPQYLCTTQVSNFVANAKREALEKAVALETAQLAGLSDEPFLSDYQCMPPALGRENPILIGVCREQAIQELADKYAGAGVALHEMAMNGLAAANALFQLHPELLESPKEGKLKVNAHDKQETPVAPDQSKVHLLLDIGAENTTAVILAGGDVLYTGGLLFGANRFTQAMAASLNVTEKEALARRATWSPDWDTEASPLLACALQLAGEMRATISHWRDGETASIAPNPIARIWLCGGGARMPGLAAYLSRTWDCPVEVFGPVLADGAPPSPEFAVAYGLALQDVGLAHLSLSLAPRLLRWQRAREDRFPYLVWATIIFFMTVVAGMVCADVWLTQRQVVLQEGMTELNSCAHLVPQLDKARDEYAHYQTMMLPIVEMGSRGQRFLQALEVVSAALEQGNWCVYMTDEFSHQDYGVAREAPPSQKSVPAPTSLFGEPYSAQETAAATPAGIAVDSLPLLRTMFIGGFTPVPGNKRFEAVLGIQNRLNASGVFRNVDWLDENTEATGREQQVMQPWENYLRSQRFQFGEHTVFKLKLPFASATVKLPPKSPAKK